MKISTVFDLIKKVNQLNKVTFRKQSIIVVHMSKNTLQKLLGDKIVAITHLMVRVSDIVDNLIVPEVAADVELPDITCKEVCALEDLTDMVSGDYCIVANRSTLLKLCESKMLLWAPGYPEIKDIDSTPFGIVEILPRQVFSAPPGTSIEYIYGQYYRRAK